jgi:hypothetical protein
VNHPEFSNVENSGFFMPKTTCKRFTHSFSLRSKIVQERFFRGERVFEEKSLIFLQKQARPDRFSNRAPFEQSEKQPVVDSSIIV